LATHARCALTAFPWLDKSAFVCHCRPKRTFQIWGSHYRRYGQILDRRCWRWRRREL